MLTKGSLLISTCANVMLTFQKAAIKFLVLKCCSPTDAVYHIAQPWNEMTKNRSLAEGARLSMILELNYSYFSADKLAPVNLIFKCIQ